MGRPVFRSSAHAVSVEVGRPVLFFVYAADRTGVGESVEIVEVDRYRTGIAPLEQAMHLEKTPLYACDK